MQKRKAYLKWLHRSSRQRPYHVEHTASRPISEVKQRWVWLVLGWVTAWEYQMLLAFCTLAPLLRLVHLLVPITDFKYTRVLSRSRVLSFYDLRTTLFALGAGGGDPMKPQPADEWAAPCTRGAGVIRVRVTLPDLIFGQWKNLPTDFGLLGLKRDRGKFSLLLDRFPFSWYKP